MDEVGPLLADQALEPEDQANVGVALHCPLEDPAVLPGGLGDVRAGWAGQQVVHAEPGEPFHDVQDLPGTAVEVAPRFDVENLHAAGLAAMTWRASSMTRSGEMSRRQVKAPLQVGRRRHGEHSRPSQITLPLARQVSR